MFHIHQVAMPKTAIHEDTCPVLPQYEVRMSRQTLMIQPIAEASFPQPTTHNHFRFRILRPDSCHVGMPLLYGKFIHNPDFRQSYTFISEYPNSFNKKTLEIFHSTT
jgi:hypothetical protein